MNTLLGRKIYRTFFLGWLLSLPLFFALSALLLPPFLRHYEHEIYNRVAPELSRQLILHAQDPAGSLPLFEELAQLTPELEPYLLDQSGVIVAARDESTLGKAVPSLVLRSELDEFRPDAPDCGFDPKGRNSCPVAHAAHVKLKGENFFVYLLTINGPADFFSTIEGRTWICGRLLLGYSFSLIMALLFAIVVTKTYAKDLLTFSSLLQSFARFDFSRRFAARSADDLGQLGAAMNSMADTLERRLKELSEATLARKQLLSRVVHDFRRPLSVMTLLLERAPRTIAAGDERECERLSKKIQNALESERLILESLKPGTGSSGHPEDAEDSFSLPVLIDELSQEMSPLFQKKGVNLSVRIESPPPKVPRGRNEYLRAFLNLLDNALQYTPEGGSVSVRIFSNSGLAFVDIEDSGIGIPRERWRRIFEPFERSLEGRKMNPSGSGIGLATVRDIIQGHGGTISIISSGQNSGTTFRCIIGTVESKDVPPVAGFDSKPGFKIAKSEPRRLRSYYIFETFALALFLLEEIYAPKIAGSGRPGGWSSATAVSILALFVTRFLIGETASASITWRNRLIRGAALMIFGALWVAGPPGIFRLEVGGDGLVYLFSLGLLLGLALAARPLVFEGLPAAIPLLAGLLWSLTGKHSEIPIVLVSFCTLCSFVIGLQAIPSTRRHHARRLCEVLIGLYLLNLLPHLYSFKNSWKEILASTSPISRPEFRVAIGNELAAITHASPGESKHRDAVRERVFTLSALNPRFDLRVFCGPLELCGYPPVGHIAATASELNRLVELTRLPGVQTDGRFDFSAVPIAEHPGLSAVFSSESTISDKALRRVSEPYVTLFIIGGIAIAILQMLFVYLFCFERQRRGLRRVSHFVASLQAGNPTVYEPKEPDDEIGRMIRDIGTLQRRVAKAERDVIHERSETQKIIEIVADTLERGRKKISSVLGLDMNAIESMTAENDKASMIVSEVFRYSLFLADEGAKSPKNHDLHQILRDAIQRAPAELELNSKIFFETVPDGTMTFVREEAVITGIQFVLRSFLNEERSISGTANPIRLVLEVSKSSSEKNQPHLRIYAPPVSHVPIERETLWMLGTKTLALSKVESQIHSDLPSGELCAVFIFPAAVTPSPG